MVFAQTPLFNKTASQCRLVGARGGRARARNLRLRRACAPVAPAATAPEPEPDRETTHEASRLLDEQFPHLRDAFAPRRTKREAILDLLRRECGATISDIRRATGWSRRTSSTFRSAVGRDVRVARILRADGTPAYIAR